MSENTYTPDTDHVRAAWEEITYLESRGDIPREVARGQFDRWFAAELRKAKAEALREAALHLVGGLNQATLNAERREIKRWLRARADEMEGEG